MPASKKKRKYKSPLSWTITRLIAAALIIIVLALILIVKTHPISTSPSPVPKSVKQATSFNFGEQKIILDGQDLNFSNGSYSNSDPATGTHTASITNRSVNPAGNRAAAILIDNPGGSGTFYYLAGAMMRGGNEIYSEPVLLGDRINIVSVSVDDPGAHDDGMITVTYLDRPANAPMTTEPTKQIMAHYAFEKNGNLITILH